MDIFHFVVGSVNNIQADSLSVEKKEQVQVLHESPSVVSYSGSVHELLVFSS